MKHINDTSRSQKRCHGLYNKVAEICTKHDAQVLLVLFSPSATNSKFYSLAYPSPKAIMDAYISKSSSVVSDDVRQLVLSQYKRLKELEKELKREKKDTKKKTDPFWWQKINIEECNSVEELEKIRDAMKEIKVNIHKQLKCKAAGLNASDPINRVTTSGEIDFISNPGIYYVENNFGGFDEAIMENEFDLSMLDFIRTELNNEDEDDKTMQSVKANFNEPTEVCANLNLSNTDDPPSDAPNITGIENDVQPSDDFMSYFNMDFVVDNFF